MFSSASGVMINGGTFIASSSTSINHTKRGIDLLMDWVATGAFHDSDELYDQPKCHPNTRVAVLNEIMNWVESEEQDDFMMWLFGPAGAGKSAIAKKIAELAAEKGLLIGTFFFSRTSPTRNIKDHLIATLAYQMTVSVPGTRTLVEDAIERDPAIFNKNLQIQIDSLLIKPFQSMSMQIIPCPKLIIIDGLDECNNSQAQIAILDAISLSFSKHKLPIIFLVVSRPEVDLVTSFNGPLKNIHRRLALDDTYHPDDDIRRFFCDKFKEIRSSHRLRSTIPTFWPTEESLKTLVRKSSGQFIFAATVVRFVESNRHRPAARLDVILGISSPGAMNPFTQLDALYKNILSSVDDIQRTLRVLSFYTVTPVLADHFDKTSRMSAESFLSLEEGDIDLALVSLSSIVLYDESSGRVKILHASLVDFLSDKRRSDEFYIDMASTRTDFACRTLQYVKCPDGIAVGDLYLLRSGVWVGGWIVNNQLRSDILNFNLDAFITAAIKNTYEADAYFGHGSDVIWALDLWLDILNEVACQSKGDQQLEEAVSQCNNSFESRLQKYQSDWRLQLLLTLATVTSNEGYQMPECRRLDVLLEMNNHELHLVDQNALDLRHNDGYLRILSHSQMIDIISHYVDSDRYASAALHCMRFLSNPLSDDSPETDLMYLEWRETCIMALDVLYEFLPLANTSLEVVEFLSSHDIDPEVRKKFPIKVWELDAHILAFLNRACICINWRIISAIRQASTTIDQPTSESETDDMESDEKEDGVMTGLISESVDQCCHLRYH